MQATLTTQQQCDINLKYILSKRAPYSKAPITKTVNNLIDLVMTPPFETAPFAERQMRSIGIFIELRSTEYPSLFYSRPYSKEEFCLCLATNREEFTNWFDDMPFSAKALLHFPGASQSSDGHITIPLAMCGLKNFKD